MKVSFHPSIQFFCQCRQKVKSFSCNISSLLESNSGPTYPAAEGHKDPSYVKSHNFSGIIHLQYMFCLQVGLGTTSILSKVIFMKPLSRRTAIHYTVYKHIILQCIFVYNRSTCLSKINVKVVFKIRMTQKRIREILGTRPGCGSSRGYSSNG